LNNAWAEILAQALSALKPGLTELAHAGAPTPEVGLELADEQGRVLADAELTWSKAQVALLRPDQDDMAMIWLGAGWHVVLLDESFTLASEKPWPQAVAPLLGLELNNRE
jgi:DEAD/DEAH box helicase domain-containing protein